MKFYRCTLLLTPTDRLSESLASRAALAFMAKRYLRVKAVVATVKGTQTFEKGAQTAAKTWLHAARPLFRKDTGGSSQLRTTIATRCAVLFEHGRTAAHSRAAIGCRSTLDAPQPLSQCSKTTLPRGRDLRAKSHVCERDGHR